MATIIGKDESLYKKITCRNCASIVQYLPMEVRWNGQTDEGRKVLGLSCPCCQYFCCTNP